MKGCVDVISNVVENVEAKERNRKFEEQKDDTQFGTNRI